MNELEEFPIKPLWNNVFVKYEKTEKVGTVIRIANEDHTARVLAVGPGREGPNGSIPCKVQPGDVVLISAKVPGLQVLFFQNEQYFSVPETSITGVIKPEFINTEKVEEKESSIIEVQ